MFQDRQKATTVTALGIAQTLAWASSYYLPAILARPMAAELGLSSSTIYAWFSGALLLTALLGPVVGRAIDRRGGRPVLALSNLVFAAGLVLIGTAQSQAWMGAGWLVLGVAMAMGLYDAAFATLAGLYGALAKGPITGVTLFAGFASTIGWPLTTFLEAEIGWRGACLAWAGLQLLLGLPLNRLLVPPAPPPAPKSAAAGEAAAAAPHAMWVIGFVFAATGIVTAAIAAHQPALLAAAGASPELALLAAALTGPAQVGARLLQFGLLGNLHPLWTSRFACVAQGLGTVALIVLGGPAAVAFTLLYGAGNGLHTIARGTLPLAVFGPVGFGQRQGLLSAPARLLQAGAPLAFGLLLEGAGALAALTAIIALCLAAFAALFALRVR
ncbi:MFS transporter [Roseomonas sp. 18066]|uniref:MFS transporter n=1 Tax=Roseomonas sp. 18066 TaxID=2681412 RepID=UPI00135A2EBB|nr:MFS transporter [Roseomonas sp. 18066]